MTDRVIAFTVLLDRDIRDDDAQPIIDAIKMIRSVVEVVPVVANVETYFAEQKARRELGRQLWEVLYPNSKRE